MRRPKMPKVTDLLLGQTGLALVRDLALLGQIRLALHPQTGVLGQTGDRHVWPNCCTGSPMSYPLPESRPEPLTADSADITDRDTPLQLGRVASVSASSALSAVQLFRLGLARRLPTCCVTSQAGWIIPEQGAPENRRPRLRSESTGDLRLSRRDRRSGSAAVPGLGCSAASRL